MTPQHFAGQAWHKLTSTVAHTSSFTRSIFHAQFCHTHTTTYIHTYVRTYLHTYIHTEAFTHRCFYTQTPLHTDTFTHRHFYPQKLSHTHKPLCSHPTAFKGQKTPIRLSPRRSFSLPLQPISALLAPRLCCRCCSLTLLLCCAALHLRR